MSVKLISPYKNLEQYTKIQIKPYQLNSDIENNMELNLRQKVEKKCNKFGYIEKVFKINNYEDGELKRENLSGMIDYKVSYNCRICIPIENTQIIAKIKAINQELIMATNGPIIIFIPKNNIDSNIWKYDGQFITKNDSKILEINNLIKIHILKTKINQNDVQIKVIGKLGNIPSEEEIENVYDFKEELKKEEDNFII